ncbi:MAG: cell surface protein [Myxococcota bacterium]|nr:cell surface protein [Myxococcota bacterium]
MGRRRARVVGEEGPGGAGSSPGCSRRCSPGRPGPGPAWAVLLAACSLLVGCVAEEEGPAGGCPDPARQGSDPYPDCVVSFTPAGSATFGHDRLPAVVLGPPQGGGEAQGGTDVVSLGCGGEIVLAFDGPGIVDRPGPDLLVFENPFRHGSGAVFVEPGEVAVSRDGQEWTAFPCRPAAAPPDPSGCAGRQPVLAAPGDGRDPTSPAEAGGDAFDLRDIGINKVIFVRITDRTADLYGSSSLYCQGAGAGFDLDGVAAVE